MSSLVLLVGGLCITFLGTDAIRFVADRLNESLLSEHGLGPHALKWFVAGVLIAYTVVIEGRDLSDLGIESMAPLPFVGWVIGGFLVTYLAGGLAMSMPGSLLKQPARAVSSMVDRRPLGWLFIVVTAGVTESILFQGYPIERLAGSIGLPTAAGVSFLAFTGAHWLGDTYSVREVLFIAVPALCMTILYALTRNLFVVVVTHTLIDGVSMASVYFAESKTETHEETGIDRTSGADGDGSSTGNIRE